LYGHPSPEGFTKLEVIDEQRRDFMLAAEKNCRKIKAGEVPFSREVNTVGAEVRFLKKALDKRLGRQVSSRYIERLQRKTTLRNYPWRHLPIEDVRENLRKARKRYRQIKPQARQKRKSFIEGLAEEKVALKGGKVSQRIKELLTIEEQRRQARAIRFALGKTRGGGVDMVITQDRYNNKVEHFTEQAIVRECLIENKAKYTQCYPTPMLQEPMVSELGYLAFNANSEAILQGTYQPPAELDYLTTAFLDELKKPDRMELNSCSDTIPVKEHIEAMRKVKENTSSGMSGLHYGLWKANAEVEELATIDATLREIPYKTGYTLKRWKKGIDVELCKEPGNFNLERLRTIVLLEADYNTNCKKVGRDAMKSAEALAKDPAAVAPEQYGSRKRHRAIEVCLNMRLVDDILRQTRRAGAICSNDAKSCYDRIIHAILSICLQRIGMKENPIRSTLETLQQLQHHIRTAFGDSEDFYEASLGQPLQGVVQGNGGGPTGWGSVSTPVINMMRSAGYGFQHWTAISKQILNIVCFAFVDDADLPHTSDTEATGEQIIEEMQDVLDTWEGGIKATGGALVPRKSYWYLIDFKCGSTGKWSYRKQAEVPGELTLPSLTEDGERVTIERLDVTEARKALGVKSRHDGKETDNVKFFRNKTSEWADHVRTNKMRSSDAWKALESTIMKGLEYPLMATCLSEKQCTDVMAPALMAALPASGIQSRFPRKLLYGPLAAQGLGLPSIFTSQTIAHCEACLRHGDQDTLTGRLLRGSLETLILEMGSSLPFWELDYGVWSPLMTDSWLKSTWRDTQSAGFHLNDTMERPQPQRDQDILLMDAFVAAGYRHKELFALNWCRMYVQAMCLSDIVNAEGSHVHPRTWACDRRDDWASRYNWPRNRRPSADAIIIWREALQKTFLRRGLGRLRQLRQPLGAWRVSNDDEWLWYYYPPDERLYCRIRGRWSHWRKNHQRTRRQRFEFDGWTETRPEEALRVSGDVLTNTSAILHSTETAEGRYQAPEAPVQLTLQGAIGALPKELAWSAERLDYYGYPPQLAISLVKGTAIAVSDGSLKDDRGTAAFHIEGEDGTTIEGVLQVPGTEAESTSHRSELGGLYGIVTVVECLALHYKITKGAIEVGCDGESALRAFDLDYFFDPQQADFDLLSSIQNRIRESSITWTPKHVLGHQDLHNPGDIDYWAALNIKMDAMAKEYWKETEALGAAPAVYTGSFSNEGWTIWRGRHKLTNLDRAYMRETIHSPRVRDWWVRHDRISAESVSKIDWALVGPAMKRMNFPRRKWLTKHASANCGVGETLVKWGIQIDSDCPRCGEPETTTHVLRCMSQEAKDQWEKSEQTLTKWMKKMTTLPQLQDVILRNLHNWREGGPTYYPQDGHQWPYVHQAIHDQEQIGWGLMLEGCLSQHWKAVQDEYYVWLDRRNTGRRWAELVIAKLIDVAWDMWEQRNQIRHAPGNPRAQKALTALDIAVIEELQRGRGVLPDTLWHHLDTSEEDLLARQEHYKKSWLRTIEVGRRYAIAQQEGVDPADVGYEPEREALRKWMLTGRY
jgi:hypothetical protein